MQPKEMHSDKEFCNSRLLLLFRALCFSGSIVFLFLQLCGCSQARQGLLSITPQQYFYSAKEKFEMIDERNFEIRDLDEIIRILENAEKDAKTSEIIDKSRMYLVLLNSLKASKQFMENRLKGQYLANRPEPFFAVDVKPMKETLRVAKKWLRACESTFKTNSILPDLLFVKGIFYTQKMLSQSGQERQECFWAAVESFRKCLGVAPDYKSDFRLFGKIQGPREVRLKLIECLALGRELVDAYSLLSEYTFSPADPRLDYPWMHMKGLVLAMMGFYEEAAEILSKFKIVIPQDFPKVDEALWVLEGVYDRLKEETGNDRFGMEARIVAAQLKKLKGPFSKEKYTTASHLFPRWLPGDKEFFSGLHHFIDGNFAEAKKAFEPLRKRGLLSSSNRLMARVLTFENDLYAGNKVTDEVLEDILSLTSEKSLSPLLKERLGFLLARYLYGEDTNFKNGRLEGESQVFSKSLTQKPWALSLKYEKERSPNLPSPKVRRGAKQTVPPAAPKNFGELRAQIFANRPDDWVVSANLSLVKLPELSLIGKGKIVGREEEGKGWLFKSEEIDEMKAGSLYLAVFEFSNSDGEKNIQGMLFIP